MSAVMSTVEVKGEQVNVTSDGLFIVFEGGEGAGKSTQVRLLSDSLVAEGHEVVVTREPGGTPTAEAIRALVLDPANSGLDPRAEALLFAAARAEHAAALIRPALERGAIVICDRYIDSSVAYQGLGRELGAEKIRELSAWATENLFPDLTVVLDIDPVVGLARAGQVSDTPDRMESEELSFHQMVRQAFLFAAEASADRYLVIDALGDPRRIHNQILDRIAE
jgi:dTMP kinase